MKISVIGAGAFGTAIAHVFGRCGYEVILGVYGAEDERHDLSATINTFHENTLWLPGHRLSAHVRAVSSFEEALDSGPDIAIWAIPSRFFGVSIESLAPLSVEAHHIVVSKGLVIRNDEVFLPSEIVRFGLIDHRLNAVSVLAGPTFATGLMINEPSVMVGAGNQDVLNALDGNLELFGSNMRIEKSNDVLGIGICSSLKTAFAIGAGILHDQGQNLQAEYLVRSLREMLTFVSFFGGFRDTVLGPAGLGDLALTSYSTESRNFVFGKLLATEPSLKDAISALEGKAIEGLEVLFALPLLLARLDSPPMSVNQIDIFARTHFPLLSILMDLTSQVGSSMTVADFVRVAHLGR